MACPLEQARQRPHVVSTEDHIDPRRLLQNGVLVLLGEASAHGDLHALMLALHRGEVAQVAVELVVGVLSDRAGINHDDVGLRAIRGDVTGRLERPAEAFGVMHVHLATKGAHLIGTGLARRIDRCGGSADDGRCGDQRRTSGEEGSAAHSDTSLREQGGSVAVTGTAPSTEVTTVGLLRANPGRPRSQCGRRRSRTPCAAGTRTTDA